MSHFERCVFVVVEKVGACVPLEQHNNNVVMLARDSDVERRAAVTPSLCVHVGTNRERMKEGRKGDG